MKHFIVSLALAATAAGQAGAAIAANQIDPAVVSFPWMNGPASGAVYRLADHPNTVFVFEAYELSCVYCNDNAPNVDALAAEFASDPSVQVIDLGLDTSLRDYQSWIAQHNPNH